jgi:hypothetical protein|tara:strand:- start:84 stop:254 length:171 start_codon:yes stop_codon:yes gene_type:complete
MSKTVVELSAILIEREKFVAQQFAAVNARLKRLELIIMATTGTTIVMLAAVVIQGM